MIANNPRRIKDLLYPKVRQSNRSKNRKPANPGPSKDLELFRRVMGIVKQFEVCYT